MNAQKEKKEPTRRCTGCGGHFPKRTLIRIVRSPAGQISLDLVGRASGRGAYLCRSVSCLKKARKARRLESTLECTVPEEVYTSLEEALSGEC